MKAVFHVSGRVSMHSVIVRDTEKPHTMNELKHASPKIDVWCGIRLSQKDVYKHSLN